jgi:hypothetical protein
LALPTGVYEVVLNGADPRVVAPLQGMKVTVKSGSNQSLELPRSLVGKYAGQVKATQGGDAAEREVSIDAKLTTGSVSERREGGPVTVQLSNGRIDNHGVYLARAAFAAATGGARADEDVQIRRAQEGAVEASFEGNKADNTRYALSGTLRPGGLTAAAQPPAPPAAPPNAQPPAAASLDQQAKAKAEEASRTSTAAKADAGNNARAERSERTERTSSSSTTRSQPQQQQAPRQATRTEPAPAPAKPAKRERAFQGTAPGG